MRSSSSCVGGRPRLLEPGLEALPLLEPHHHVGGGVGLEHARDAHDAGVLEAGKRARLLQEVRAAPFERLLVAVGLRPHAHRPVAVTEVERVVFLQSDRGAELDVFGHVGNAEAARAHHPLDAIAAIDNRIHRQSEATVHDIPSRPACRL